LSSKASLTGSLRYDWQNRRVTGENREGWRVVVDYFYFDYRRASPDANGFGLKPDAHVVRVFGNVTYPDSLAPGDRNAVVTGGADYSARVSTGVGRWTFAPFLGFSASWDSDGNDFNNKFQPGVGAAFRHPLPGGDVAIGLRVRADYRWRSGDVRGGPSMFMGWFSAF